MSQPWTPLHAQLHQVLRSRPLIPKCQRVLVAVSGGQDSLCLIRLLLDLQPKWNWQVAIAHCNHRWRTDADANAAYVEQLAQTWDIPYYGLTVADDQRPNIQTETGARTWRYQVLAETAIAQGYGAIATGHTASDRAETLLYNLMRGSGTDGIQSLTWQRSLGLSPLQGGPKKDMEEGAINLVRPLLCMTRQDTGQFCQDANLTPWFDSTNDDWHYARNRIRQELLPYLQKHFNPGVEHNLAQTAEILQADVAYLNAETDKLWHQVIGKTDGKAEGRRQKAVGETRRWGDEEMGRRGDEETGRRGDGETGTSEPKSKIQNPKSKVQNPKSKIQNRLAFNRKRLASAPLALQRRVLRRCLIQLLPKAPNFDHIEKLVALITAPNRSQTDPFPGGAIARVDGEWIVIERSPP